MFLKCKYQKYYICSFSFQLTGGTGWCQVIDTILQADTCSWWQIFSYQHFVKAHHVSSRCKVYPLGSGRDTQWFNVQATYGWSVSENLTR